MSKKLAELRKRRNEVAVFETPEQREIRYRGIQEASAGKKYSWHEQHLALIKILAHLNADVRDGVWLSSLEKMLITIMPFSHYFPYELSRVFDPSNIEKCRFDKLFDNIAEYLDHLGPDLDFFVLSNSQNVDTKGKVVVDVSESPYASSSDGLKYTNGFLDPKGRLHKVEGDQHEVWADKYVHDRSNGSDNGGQHSLSAEGWVKLRAWDWMAGPYTPVQIATILLWAEYHHVRENIPRSIIEKIRTKEEVVMVAETRHFRPTTIEEVHSYTEQDMRAHGFIRARLMEHKLAGEPENQEELDLGKSIQAAAQDIMEVWKEPTLAKGKDMFPLATKIGVLMRVLSRSKETKDLLRDFKIITEHFLALRKKKDEALSPEEQRDVINKFYQFVRILALKV